MTLVVLRRTGWVCYRTSLNEDLFDVCFLSLISSPLEPQWSSLSPGQVLGREVTVLFSTMKPAYKAGEKPAQKGKAIPLGPRDHLGHSEISVGILAPEVLGQMHPSASSPVEALASERESWLGDWGLQRTSSVHISPEPVPKERLLHSQLLWSMGTHETENTGVYEVLP